MKNMLFKLILINDLKTLLILLGIPAIFIFLLTIINRITKGMLADAFDFKSQI